MQRIEVPTAPDPSSPCPRCSRPLVPHRTGQGTVLSCERCAGAFLSAAHVTELRHGNLHRDVLVVAPDDDYDEDDDERDREPERDGDANAGYRDAGYRAAADHDRVVPRWKRCCPACGKPFEDDDLDALVEGAPSVEVLNCPDHGIWIGHADLGRCVRGQARIAGALRVHSPDDLERTLLHRSWSLIRADPLVVYTDRRGPRRAVACGLAAYAALAVPLFWFGGIAPGELMCSALLLTALLSVAGVVLYATSNSSIIAVVPERSVLQAVGRRAVAWEVPLAGIRALRVTRRDADGLFVVTLEHSGGTHTISRGAAGPARYNGFVTRLAYELPDGVTIETARD